MSTATDPELILASSSPRRRELLALLSYPYRVEASETPERGFDRGSPDSYATALAVAKAREVAARHAGERVVVLGADTIVTLGGQVFGKPSGPDAATRMLQELSGRTHEVITGVSVVDAASGAVMQQSVTTRVTFRTLSDAQIERYVATGEPLDKAGAYAVQGGAAIFVTRIEGCYFNVVGLPVATVADMLSAAGVPVL